MKLAICVLALAACGGKKDAPAAGSTSDVRDALLDVWKKGGLAPSAFAAATAPIAAGGDCSTGSVSGVDVAVCLFPTPDAAKAAEPAGLAWVGDTTGISRARGVVLVAAADRKKADPHGKTLDALMKLLPKS